jgi:hypothetical protein
MATFDKLLEGGVIVEVTVQLRSGQFPERKLYVYPECLDWMRNDVPQMVSGRLASALTPVEQLRERLRQWTAGDRMAYGRWFQDLTPARDEVWELKTADLRIFGWMYRPREFIAVRGGYADDYKEPTKRKNYADERRAVVEARDAFPLDGEKYATGAFDDLI